MSKEEPKDIGWEMIQIIDDLNIQIRKRMEEQQKRVARITERLISLHEKIVLQQNDPNNKYILDKVHYMKKDKKNIPGFMKDEVTKVSGVEDDDDAYIDLTGNTSSLQSNTNSKKSTKTNIKTTRNDDASTDSDNLPF